MLAEVHIMNENELINELINEPINEQNRKVGNGPSTKYIVELESVELLTQLQMAMEILKKQVT